MRVPTLKRHVILASFLLSHVSPLFMSVSWGMETEDQKVSIKKQSLSKLCLSEALENFEMGQDEIAGNLFVQLRKAGATVPIKYLEYFQIDCPLSFEPVPPAAQKLSQEFFDASLCYRNYMKSQTREEKKTHLLNLEKMMVETNKVLGTHNFHAITLFKKLYEKKDENILSYFPKESLVKKQVGSADEVYKFFVPFHFGSTVFWNCLDPEHLLFLYRQRTNPAEKTLINRDLTNKKKAIPIFPENELKYFSDLYLTGKFSISQIIKKLISSNETSQKTKPFWAHFAVENGINEGCVLAADSCYQLDEPLSNNPRLRIKDEGSLLYYTSCIKEENKFLLDKQKNLFLYSGQIFFSKKIDIPLNQNKAFNYWERAADLGNARAQHNYAVELLKKGGKQNQEKAYQYLKLAAESGHLEAQRIYAQISIEENVNEINLSEAFKHQKNLADRKDSHDQFNYALMLYDGDGGPKNYQGARKYFQLAADQGHEKAQLNFARMLKEGEGGKIDLTMARLYYKMAADQGDSKIQYYYALGMKNGVWGQVNENAAAVYAKKSADQGDIKAQYVYATHCAMGRGVPKNVADALKYFKLAADQKNAEAQYNADAQYQYARLLLTNNFKEQNGDILYDSLLIEGETKQKLLLEACKYAKMAADQGHVAAQFCYGSLCTWDEVYLKNLEDAFKYFKLAADKDDVKAQFCYASVLLREEATEQERVEARKYFKMAVAQRCVESTYKYAWMLDSGDGGEKILDEARMYFKIAADLGHKEAQVQYATMCYFGRGGIKNPKDAKDYFKRAADQGHIGAQSNYAGLCMLDKQGGKNKAEALKYAKMAADLGSVDAQHNYGIFLFEVAETQEDYSEALKYFKMAADQGDIDALIYTHMLNISWNLLKDAEKSDSTPKDHNKELAEKECSDDYVEINFEEITDSLNEEEKKFHQELEQLNLKNQQQIAELRAKKQLNQKGKKTAASLTRQTLTVNKKDYDATCKNFQVKMGMVEQTEKLGVDHNTLELVKTIFGQGTQKINTFSNLDAKKAFANLGCSVSDGESENSTLLSFKLAEGRIMKLKYHNPHGHGDHNLYKAMKPYFKRFLTSINKTPQTLQVKNIIQ